MPSGRAIRPFSYNFAAIGSAAQRWLQHGFSKIFRKDRQPLYRVTDRIALKTAALAKLQPHNMKRPARFEPEDRLLTFLDAL